MGTATIELIAQGVGERLRQLRLEQGLSQEKLANKAGITREAYRQAEMGISIPRWRNLESLANELGVSLWDLLPVPRSHTSYYVDNSLLAA